MKKTKKNGFLFGMLGTFLVLLGVVGYILVSVLFNRLFIGLRFGDGVAGAIMTFFLTGVIIAFVLYEAIFITWQIKMAREGSREGDVGGNMKKILRIVTVAAISLSILCAAVSANIFTELREDSISTVAIFPTKEYSIKAEDCDVRAYSFTCDESGSMTFKLTMNDGNVIEILGGVTSISDGFREKYDANQVSLLKYAADITERLNDTSDGYIIKKRITSSTIENAKNVYSSDESMALLWKQIERIINNATAE